MAGSTRHSAPAHYLSWTVSHGQLSLRMCDAVAENVTRVPTETGTPGK